MQLFFFTNPTNLKNMNLIWKNLVFSHFFAQPYNLFHRYIRDILQLWFFSRQWYTKETQLRGIWDRSGQRQISKLGRDAQDVAVISSGNQWSGAQHLWQPLLCLATVSSSKLLRRRYLSGRHNPLNPIINSIYNSYIAKCTLININQCWYYL